MKSDQEMPTDHPIQRGSDAISDNSRCVAADDKVNSVREIDDGADSDGGERASAESEESDSAAVERNEVAVAPAITLQNIRASLNLQKGKKSEGLAGKKQYHQENVRFIEWLWQSKHSESTIEPGFAAELDRLKSSAKFPERIVRIRSEENREKKKDSIISKTIRERTAGALGQPDRPPPERTVIFEALTGSIFGEYICQKVKRSGATVNRKSWSRYQRAFRYLFQRYGLQQTSKLVEELSCARLMAIGAIEAEDVDGGEMNADNSNQLGSFRKTDREKALGSVANANGSREEVSDGNTDSDKKRRDAEESARFIEWLWKTHRETTIDPSLAVELDRVKAKIEYPYAILRIDSKEERVRRKKLFLSKRIRNRIVLALGYHGSPPPERTVVFDAITTDIIGEFSCQRKIRKNMKNTAGLMMPNTCKKFRTALTFLFARYGLRLEPEMAEEINEILKRVGKMAIQAEEERAKEELQNPPAETTPTNNHTDTGELPHLLAALLHRFGKTKAHVSAALDAIFIVDKRTELFANRRLVAERGMSDGTPSMVRSSCMTTVAVLGDEINTLDGFLRAYKSMVGGETAARAAAGLGDLVSTRQFHGEELPQQQEGVKLGFADVTGSERTSNTSVGTNAAQLTSTEDKNERKGIQRATCSIFEATDGREICGSCGQGRPPLPLGWTFPRNLSLRRFLELSLLGGTTGDDKVLMPPLITLKSSNFRHITRGQHNYNDMRSLLRWVEQVGRAKGVWKGEAAGDRTWTKAEVHALYQGVKSHFLGRRQGRMGRKRRNEEISWTTIIRNEQVRRKKAKHEAPSATEGCQI